MGSGTLLCPTPAAQRPSGAGRGESRSWAGGGALEVRGSIGNSQCTRALGRCERHAPERLGRRGAGCGTSPSKARATDAVVTGLCRGYAGRAPPTPVRAPTAPSSLAPQPGDARTSPSASFPSRARACRSALRRRSAGQDLTCARVLSSCRETTPSRTPHLGASRTFRCCHHQDTSRSGEGGAGLCEGRHLAEIGA